MNEEQDQKTINKLIDDIGGLLDGHENAIATHALMASLAIMVMMNAPPDRRNKALVYIFKSIRTMVRDGSNAERMRIQ